jgi:hypothetical protein
MEWSLINGNISSTFHKFMLNSKARELQTQSGHCSMSFLFHCGLLSFGCQGNRLNQFVLLSFCAEHGRLPHSCPLIPTHYFIISWIPKQNIGDSVEYIKETNSVFKYTRVSKNPTETVVISEDNAILQNCKSYNNFLITFYNFTIHSYF